MPGTTLYLQNRRLNGKNTECHFLRALEDIKFHRSYGTGAWKCSARMEMHTFCDASEMASSAVSYLRIVNNTSEVQVTFGLGKAKLTAAHTTTIPRLELWAAFLRVEMTEPVHKELEQNRIRWPTTRTANSYWVTSQMNPVYSMYMLATAWNAFVARQLHINGSTLPYQYEPCRSSYTINRSKKREHARGTPDGSKVSVQQPFNYSQTTAPHQNELVYKFSCSGRSLCLGSYSQHVRIRC